MLYEQNWCNCVCEEDVGDQVRQKLRNRIGIYDEGEENYNMNKENMITIIK